MVDLPLPQAGRSCKPVAPASQPCRAVRLRRRLCARPRRRRLDPGGAATALRRRPAERATGDLFSPPIRISGAVMAAVSSACRGSTRSAARIESRLPSRQTTAITPAMKAISARLSAIARGNTSRTENTSTTVNMPSRTPARCTTDCVSRSDSSASVRAAKVLPAAHRVGDGVLVGIGMQPRCDIHSRLIRQAAHALRAGLPGNGHPLRAPPSTSRPRSRRAAPGSARPASVAADTPGTRCRTRLRAAVRGRRRRAGRARDEPATHDATEHRRFVARGQRSSYSTRIGPSRAPLSGLQNWAR